MSGGPPRATLAPWALALLAAASAVAACSVIAGDRLTDAQQVIADMKIGPAEPTAAGLKIIGAVDRADRRYRVGEPIALSVEVDKAAFVAVLRVMPNGATTLIFPNRQQVGAQVPAHSPLPIPGAGASFTVAADKPGVALFEFIAAKGGTSWLFNRKPEGSADFVELGTTTRALAKDILLSLGAGRGNAAAAHLTVRVEGD